MSIRTLKIRSSGLPCWTMRPTPCLNYAFPDYLERGRQALSQCGLEGREEEYVWQLSGGQTHLLALAGAVSLGPDILILDEPIAQLDPMHADRIYEVLRHLNQTGQDHHRHRAPHRVHCRLLRKNVLLMKDGRCNGCSPTDEALRRVEELEACNIFPPQVTRAAHRMGRRGSLAALGRLPTTVEEGQTGLCLSVLSSSSSPAPSRNREEPAVTFSR